MAFGVTEIHTPSSSSSRMFAVDFFGYQITATVTATPSVARKWIGTTIHRHRRHLGRLVVGVGVQWLPDYSSATYSPASTLQLCVGRRCLVFQIVHAIGVPANLRRFLLHPQNVFVGIWNHSDARKLLASPHQIEMGGPILDLRHHARSRSGASLARESMETIVRECLGLEGVRLDSSISRSNWNEYWLSDAQVGQVCVDAYVAFEIGKNLRATWEVNLISDDDDDEDVVYL